jgi:microcystin-dependent protein
MADPYIGEIRIFAGNFAPAGWAFCDGSLLPIAENDALFILIGTTYGGDGQATFALPDLRGRVPLHAGNGYTLGQVGGSEAVTLTEAQLPQHAHPAIYAQGGTPTTSPINGLPASGAVNLFAAAATPAGAATTSAGASQPHENMAPFLAISFIIALFGIFPSQT